jgi:hypothetical protein
VDGKAVQGTWHANCDGQAVHLLAAADQQAGTVLAQTDVDGNERVCMAWRPPRRDEMLRSPPGAVAVVILER